MTESSGTLPHRWQNGLHPGAAGLRIVSLGRVDLPIGEALRLEMVDAEPGDQDVVHVQYYIVSEAGGWALWLSCPRGELADTDAALRQMTPPVAEEP